MPRPEQPEALRQLPRQPGVYRFYDKEEQLIYVGKAKDLRARVSSYFNGYEGHNRKTQRLVTQIVRIEHTVVESEFDAFLLENGLIKEFQPRYNIRLKDDKSYPFLCLSDEPFPRLFGTRRREKNEGDYFGPYTNVKAMNAVSELLHKLFHIRTCKLPLTTPAIAKGKWEVCLEYHMGNCLGPCANKQTEQDYRESITQAKAILKGKIGQVATRFRERMKTFAEQMQFELAAEEKRKLELLEKFQMRTQISSPELGDMEVLAVAKNEKQAVVHHMRIEEGAVVESAHHLLQLKLDESEAELIVHALAQIENSQTSTAKRLILSPVELELPPDQFEVQVPKIGDKRKLVLLAQKNANARVEELSRRDRSQAEKQAVRSLQVSLHLSDAPEHIECFDNSNLQGSNPVAAMVSFKEGKASKKDYRHFKIRTVEGPDDFASMREIVTRRYQRLMDEGANMPSLIVIDGGKGQLSAAVEALQDLGIYGQVPIIGLAKRIEEIFFPGDQDSLVLARTEPGLQLLQRIRDEAHRFAISFHRDQRSKAMTASAFLEGINGIGPQSKKLIRESYPTLEHLRSASIPELARLLGPRKAKILRDALAEKGGAAPS